jgi:hypothetical protein
MVGCNNVEIPEGCIDESLIDESIMCTMDVTYVNACAAINWNGITDFTLGECED